MCTGRLPITVAQQEIATDWVKYYLAWHGDTGSLLLSSSTSAQSNSSSDAATSSAPTFYTSSYSTAKYYYPASCGAWKSLSASYLVGFSSLDALLIRYQSVSLAHNAERLLFGEPDQQASPIGGRRPARGCLVDRSESEEIQRRSEWK